MIFHTKQPVWLSMVCSNCTHVWDAEFVMDHGELINVDAAGEECPECKSNQIEEAQ